jgi:hypothetical protein
MKLYQQQDCQVCVPHTTVVTGLVEPDVLALAQVSMRVSRLNV